MKRLGFFLILAMLFSGFYVMRQTVYAQPVSVTDNSKQQILAATLQIKMKAPLLDELGQPKIAKTDGRWHTIDETAHGLGTLIRVDDQFFIVTHDHWGILLHTAVIVQLHNAQGHLLAELEGNHFRNLIVYQDQGTMLVKAPVDLQPIFRFAVSANSQYLAETDVVLLTRHHPGARMVVEVVAAQVTAVTQRHGVPAYRLTSLDGSIVVEGDSGGGLWFDGQLAGNLWRTIALDTIQMANGQELSTSQAITADSIAAAYPDIIEHLRQPAQTDESEPMPQHLEPVTP